MRNDTTRQSVLFPKLLGKPLVAKFDEPHSSSDGGAILLKACDERLRLSERLADCLSDKRQAGKVAHSLSELVRQRVFGLACGYADCNDAARLVDDPIHKLLVSGEALGERGLASQPTLSRFENAVDRKALFRMGRELAEMVIEQQRRRRRGQARRITIDLDPTDDPTYGQQQLSFFNGHYRNWCYLPMVAFAQFDEEHEQHLLSYVMRPGNAPATRGAVGLLRRLVGRLREAFPKARLLIRLDGGFAAPEVLEYLEGARVKYVVAMARNPVLERHAEPYMVGTRRLAQLLGQTTHVYGECRYAARSWPHERRVIFKAEVVQLSEREPRDNARFVITNLTHAPQTVYEHYYCRRGEIENRIKELHYGMQIDRTSCTSFLANQFRGLLTAAAYVLMQHLREQAAQTSFARAQVNTLRERLLKLSARVCVSARRIVLHLPATYPFGDEWRRVARSIGAVPT